MKNITLKNILFSILGLTVGLSPLITHAASPLTASCVGTPSSSSIIWTANSSGGVPPISFLWSNNSTSSTQTVSVVPGTYSMTLQATDASSTIATSTCSTIVTAPTPSPAPTITSFIANPTTITSGQSTTLSWVVNNASSTSLDNGIGVITTTTAIVTPAMTTTYQLSATNPSGTTVASITVTVNTTSAISDLQARIQNLLNQIANLRAQLAQLLITQGQSGGTATSTPPVNNGTCSVFTRNLSYGDNGNDVKALQQLLAQNPSIYPQGRATGFFGRDTEKAIKRYQQRFGIFATGSTTTGYFGPMSRGFLQEHCDEINNENDQGNHDN